MTLADLFISSPVTLQGEVFFRPECLVLHNDISVGMDIDIMFGKVVQPVCNGIVTRSIDDNILKGKGCFRTRDSPDNFRLVPGGYLFNLENCLENFFHQVPGFPYPIR